MYCPRCGKELPEGSKFCGYCGAVLGEGDHPMPPTPTPTPEPAPTKNLLATILKIAGIAVAAAAVVVLAVFLGRSLLGGSGKNTVVYFSGDKYGMVKNLKKGTTEDFARGRMDDSYVGGSLTFTEDGKYIYFFTRSNGSTGTLNRLEVSKLGRDIDKTEKHITTVDTNVQIGEMTVLKNGGAVYMKGDSNDLCCYSGKEPVRIEREIDSYVSDGDQQVVYARQDGESEDDRNSMSIYKVSLKSPEKPERIASGVWEPFFDLQEDTLGKYMLFSKFDDDETATLYQLEIASGEATKIGTHYQWVGKSQDGTLYYMVDSENNVNLYDYVTDSKAEADAGIVEPDEAAFEVPYYSYSMIDENTDISGFPELYTSCTNDVLFISGGWFSYYSMEYAAENDTDHAADYAAFVNKYKAQEDKDGYLLVTDAVKSDLISLAAKCGTGVTNEWYRFCFSKEQDGTTTDWDAYEAAQDAYNEASSRIALRNELTSDAGIYPQKNLYRFADGSNSLVAENVLSAESRGDVILARLTSDSQEEDKRDLENFTYLDEVKEFMGIGYGSTITLISMNDGSSYRVRRETLEDHVTLDSYYSLWHIGKEMLLYSGEDEGLYQVTMDDNTLTGFDLVAEDVYIYGCTTDTLYYFMNCFSRNDRYYGDFCSWKDGKSTAIGKEVLRSDWWPTVYEDGSALVAYSYRSDYGAELSLISAKGEETRIGDDITDVLRVDSSTMLYIQNGDLYCKNGGKTDVRIQSDVERYNMWSQKKMDRMDLLIYD